MWVYLIIFFIIAILTFSRKNKPQFTSSIIIIFLILVAGFRGNIDKDYSMYVDKFELISAGHLVIIEPFFILVSLISSYVFNNVIALFLIFATVGELL